MFCSVKRDKKNNKYKFYLCDRYRDKETGRVKSSDKYVMTLPKEKIIGLSNDEIKFDIENVLINKGISLENIDLILEKLISIRKVVTEEYSTTNKIDIVVQANNTTNINKNIEIIQAEIVEEFTPTYDTTIMFDIQQMYRKNIDTAMKFNIISKAFGGRTKEKFEIEEEELKQIKGEEERIKNKIDDIYKEYLYINEQNNIFKALGSDIRLVQDIYISCYDKFPSSEIWLIGGGYIRQIYGKLDFVLPGYGENIFDGWEELKEYYKLNDNKAYFNHEEYFEEMDLYRADNLDIDKSDITGSLIKMILSGNYEIDMSFSDWIDIKVDGDTIGLNIEHFIDWINNKPTRYYKVTIDTLMEYRKQLYKFKNVK